MPTHGFSDSASFGFVRLEQNAYVSVRHKATGPGACGGAKGTASMHLMRLERIEHTTFFVSFSHSHGGQAHNVAS